MDMVAIEPLLQPFEVCDRLFTVADLEFMPTDLPSGPIDYELDNGRLVFIMVPTGDVHGAVTVHSADSEPKVYGENEVLWLPSMIPNFSLPIVDVFRE